jgi:hypothetical protein
MRAALAVRHHKSFRRFAMTRTNFSRTSLIGAAAAGLVTLAAGSAAWAQAATYPQGTDCSTIQNSANRMDCTKQMNEQQQNSNQGVVTPSPSATDNGTDNSDVNPNDPATNNSAQPGANGGNTDGNTNDSNGGTTN